MVRWVRMPGWLPVPVAALIVTMAIPDVTQAVARTGGLALDFPYSGRSWAMASSGVGDMSDPGNVYYNPAAIAGGDGVFISGGREFLRPFIVDDLWFGSINAGGARTIGSARSIRLAFDLTLARFSYGKSIATQPDGTVLGEVESHEDVFGFTTAVAGAMGGVGYWSLGVALKRWAADYAPASFTVEPGARPSAWMVDVGAVVGAAADIGDWRLTPALGLAVVNAGPDIEVEYAGETRTDPLPTWFNHGYSIRLDSPEVMAGRNRIPVLSLTVNADRNQGMNDQTTRWAFGWEATLLQAFSVRRGVQTHDGPLDNVDTWGIGLGLPVGPLRMRFDYTQVTGDRIISRDVYGLSLIWLTGRGGG